MPGKIICAGTIRIPEDAFTATLQSLTGDLYVLTNRVEGGLNVEATGVWCHAPIKPGAAQQFADGVFVIGEKAR